MSYDEDAVRKEATQLLDAVMRLCDEADYPEAALTALGYAMRISAERLDQGPCCALSQMFVIFAQKGDPRAVRPDVLFGDMIDHLVKEGVLTPLDGQ